MDRKGNVKEHVDLGRYKSVDCFFAMKHNLDMSNIWLRLGGFYFAKDVQLGFRAERDHTQTPMLSLRTVLKRSNLTFASCGILNLSSLKLTKFDSALLQDSANAQFSLSTYFPFFFNNVSTLAKNWGFNTKVGASYKLSNKSQLGLSLTKNHDCGFNDLGFEIGLAGQCTDKLNSKIKVLFLLFNSISA